MQLDFFELIEVENKAAESALQQEQLQEEVERKKEAIGQHEFDRIKSERALSIQLEDLPWRPWTLFPDYEECDVQALIPPNAISSLEYSRRFENTKYGDPVAKEFHELWGSYNHAIWDFEDYEVDWCKAWRILDDARDAGEPVWIRLIRAYGKVRFFPECIVAIENEEGNNQMILFKQEHVAPILAGTKTQTRRTGACRWKVGSVRQAKLNYRKDSEFAKLRITGIRQERLGDISEADAIREGYNSVEEYKEAFRRIYGKWEDELQVWVIDFERLEDE